MKTRPPTPILGRSSLALAIVLLGLALVLTMILIEPSSAQRQISSKEAADFMGYVGTVCGRVNSVQQDPIAINTLLIFGDPESPSFAVSISRKGRDLEPKYKGNQVCVAGRIADAWGSGASPSITVTDESQISIE